jgi:hypothetical protein
MVLGNRNHGEPTKTWRRTEAEEGSDGEGG